MAEILINSRFFKNNLDTITAHIKDKNKLALVLKDNAYGHGLEQIATLAHNYGIKNVFVKNESEALKIAHLFEYVTALYGSLSPHSPRNIALSINAPEALENIKAGAYVELKVNTGMNRNGIPISALESFVSNILHKKLHLLGVFAHNAYGDETGGDFEKAQKNFLQVKQTITYLSNKLGFPLPRFHTLSSSGTLRSAVIDDDLVRIGIGAYGYLGNTFPLPIADSLKPIASLWADKICEQHLLKGSKIGYGGKSILDQDTTISTYDVGYGDGLFRHNGNKGTLTTAEGYLILPITSMDCFSCISRAKRVCVFDNAQLLAQMLDTIPYEILTNLSPFIKRTII
ncbi:alanine racemase [Helicobacter sp. 12S02634-8]|uniref:alanine racemase n=1 Tax=Helicobacter sp. 12S02634-8 TaxID=1476199 RepID=UPI000BA74AA8|nr:alanine racemase [Helicobacter sp. 12S02634-8]PAF48451.1 alanine racemase [Helicobacter sp. 12S02634-8]